MEKYELNKGESHLNRSLRNRKETYKPYKILTRTHFIKRNKYHCYEHPTKRQIVVKPIKVITHN